MKNENEIELLGREMDRVAKTRVEKAKFDKTYEAVIEEILFDEGTTINDENYKKYRVRYNGQTQDLVINDENVHSVLEQVYITVNCNDLAKKKIDFNKNFYPYKIKYIDGTETEFLDINGTTTEVTIDKVEETWKVVTAYKKEKETGIPQIEEETKKYIPESSFEYLIEYKFAILNKDTDDEDVIAMIFPDGQLMEIENF